MIFLKIKYPLEAILIASLGLFSVLFISSKRLKSVVVVFPWFACKAGSPDLTEFHFIVINVFKDIKKKNYIPNKSGSSCE